MTGGGTIGVAADAPLRGMTGRAVRGGTIALRAVPVRRANGRVARAVTMTGAGVAPTAVVPVDGTVVPSAPVAAAVTVMTGVMTGAAAGAPPGTATARVVRAVRTTGADAVRTAVAVAVAAVAAVAAAGVAGTTGTVGAVTTVGLPAAVSAAETVAAPAAMTAGSTGNRCVGCRSTRTSPVRRSTRRSGRS